MPSLEQLPGKHEKGVRSFREDNDFADMTLACVDDQQVEAPKLFLAGQVLFNRLFHSHHHINIIVKKQARGSSWALVVKPALPWFCDEKKKMGGQSVHLFAGTGTF